MRWDAPVTVDDSRECTGGITGELICDGIGQHHFRNITKRPYKRTTTINAD